MKWNPNRVCEQCLTSYVANSPTQKYCGSQKDKVGCSHALQRLKTKLYQIEAKKDPIYYARLQEKRSEYWQNNKHRFKDSVSEWAKAHYLKNKSRILESNRQYWLIHPELRRECKARRRAREYNAIGSHTSEEWELLKKLYDYTCLKCFRSEPNIKLTADHKIPLSKGGSDNIDNIQPLCGRCNSSKATKVWFASCLMNATLRLQIMEDEV